MVTRKKDKSSLIFALVIGLVALGAYFYTSVIPYHFPNQWQPTPDELSAGGVYDRTQEKGVFLGQEVISHEVPEPKELAQVLGERDGGNKRIEVDLTNQRVYAYEGDNRVFEFVVSTGKWGATPTGTFTIQYKTRAQKMSGGSRALRTYYYLPNVPYVQFFGNSQIPWSRGFSFHGTYWHSNFGHPMSHGCINMKTEDAEKLYYWTTPSLGDKRTVKMTSENPGTPVVIYGTTPTS
jgi:lipoprotein-anchoring transpeptidase ErfK/SrfK